MPKWAKLTVAKLAARDGRHCLHCGTTDTLTVQHRGVKGMGGRNSAERPSNGIIICWELNVAAEANQAYAEMCLAHGWKISTHADPTQIPVYDATTGSSWLLNDDFGRTKLD